MYQLFQKALSSGPPFTGYSFAATIARKNARIRHSRARRLSFHVLVGSQPIIASQSMAPINSGMMMSSMGGTLSASSSDDCDSGNKLVLARDRKSTRLN